MERKNYTVAIDLGSSTVVVAVGEKTADGEIDVAAITSKPVEGVVAGQIDNIELVSTAIREAVAEVEEQLNIRITEAYAGISGNFVRCARHTDHVFVAEPHNSVSQADVQALYDRMCNVQAPDNEMIMERLPQNYMVDTNREVINPVGSFGRRLSSTFNFILCNKTPIQRLDMALKRLGIKLLGVIPNVIASPEAVLQSFDKEDGVAVVDIGGGVTDVAVYHNNALRYAVTIPMGASAINRDIYTMGIFKKRIEKLKRDFGSAVADLAPADKVVRVTGRTPRESKDIILRNLATVIEARATDIVEFVLLEIKDSGFINKLGNGIVLTGGSAQLKDIDELFRRHSGMNVRVALPEAELTEESLEKLDSPAYSTIAGLLIKGAEKGACAVVERAKPAEQHNAAEPQPHPFRRPEPPRQEGYPRQEEYNSGYPHTAAPQQPRQPQPAAPRQPYTGAQAPRPAAPVQQPQQPYAAPAAAPRQPERPTPPPVPQQPGQPRQPAFGSESPEREEPRTEPQPLNRPQQPQQPRQPEAADSEVGSAEETGSKKRPKRDWMGIFSNAFNKFNNSFSSVDDDEI